MPFIIILYSLLRFYFSFDNESKNDSYYDNFSKMDHRIIKTLDHFGKKAFLPLYQLQRPSRTKRSDPFHVLARLQVAQQCREQGEDEKAESFYDKAAEYWKQAIRLSPNNYLEAQNWLKTTGRSEMDVFF